MSLPSTTTTAISFSSALPSAKKGATRVIPLFPEKKGNYTSGPFFCANFGAVKLGIIGITVMAVLLTLQGCSPTSADSGYFGKTDPPPGQTLRYITGPEPQSLDPQIGTGLSEARIYMALYEGLVIYDPKTMGPYPGIAEKWDINDNFTQFTFHLRKNARFSNGDPITAEDFVWSLRRGLNPKLAAEYAYIAYPILNAEGYNSGGSFVRNQATGASISIRQPTLAAS